MRHYFHKTVAYRRHW